MNHKNECRQSPGICSFSCECWCHEEKSEPQPTDRDALVEVIREALGKYYEKNHTYAFGKEIEYVADALIAAGWRKNE